MASSRNLKWDNPSTLNLRSSSDLHPHTSEKYWNFLCGKILAKWNIGTGRLANIFLCFWFCGSNNYPFRAKL